VGKTENVKESVARWARAAQVGAGGTMVECAGAAQNAATVKTQPHKGHLAVWQASAHTFTTCRRLVHAPGVRGLPAAGWGLHAP